ncbi:hypothetical protein APHAL10511_007092 [Amanita phalloides]|nr:hypothetical protein APHAL10511_007092 [Amanita phalloides]
MHTTEKLHARVCRLLTDPKLFWALAFLVIFADAILTKLIIEFIPYTEIDWNTYMVHIDLYLKGERDYSKLTGPTGPLVYPAGHIRIHELLYKITDSGRNLKVAQNIYGLLYIVSLFLSCAIYRSAGLPNWIVLLLPLSKRLHSIFVLRLFNDCWAVVLSQVAILMFQAGLDDTGVLLYSAALSVKMSILLYLPGLLVVLFKRRGLGSTLRYTLTIVVVQALLASSFLQRHAWAYIRSAFDLGRVFLYKWTVNWRFIDEDVFLSRQWALGLLIGHASTLILFGLFKWCNADGGVSQVLKRGLRQPLSPASLTPLTGDDVATILFTSNLIGILFARSLHYQFYSWYAHQIPYLAWKTKYPLLFRLALLVAFEYAWNTYPSTPMSSGLLLLANASMVVVHRVVTRDELVPMASANAKQQVLATYSAPPAFLASGSWKQIHTSLLAQLPLRNIHWRSSSYSVLRTIQELEFTLVPIDAVRDESTSQIPVTVLEKPLLNIYIITCEDTDVEAYRLIHKKQVKDWLNSVTPRKNQEWLLLHLVKHDARAPGGKLFHLKGSVLERMRADLNTDKRDRCVQIIWTPGSEGNAAIWAEFLNKIKEGLVYAFDSAISQREEEVKRSESQRQMPGWNFCTFFILKESLSNSFEGMNLFEEALLQYDELEETFTHVLKEKNLSWFGSLIAPHQTDDSSPLLSSTKKPYRDLILANNISVFDLRIYLLARRCELLAMLWRVTEAAWKAKLFLVGFARQLRRIEKTLPNFFIESWLYNSALSIVDQCDEWILAHKTDESQISGYYAAKGELLELAQIQLNLIGTSVDHLPSRSPFHIGPRGISIDSTQSINNSDIRQCINDQDFFYDLYTAITNRAIEMYAQSKRRKFALKLHESLAALDVHRGRLATALATYSSLPAHYAPHMWSSLESFTLLQALLIHAGLQKTKDTEWIHILLDFLKTAVECSEIDSLFSESNRIEHISSLLQSLRTVSSTLETDLTHPGHPALAITITDKVILAGSSDGVFLDIVVYNHLPCGVPADEVSVCASGRDGESLLFSAEVNELVIGKATLTLFCPVSCAGIYVLDLCQVRIGRLSFQWLYKRQGHRGLHTTQMPVLIRVPSDPFALDIQIRQPSHIKLDHPPSLLATISTGRNNISRIILKLAAAGLSFQWQHTTILEGQVMSASVVDGVTYTGVATDSTLALHVPYIGNSLSHILKITVDLSYVTTSEPNVARELHTTRMLTTALPFSVNVEDFFRDKSLISKFTISAVTHQHVRIASISLETPPNLSKLRVTSCPIDQSVMTVRPTEPIHSLFRLDCEKGPVREPLNLVVQYRMLREEVEELVQRSVQESSATASSPSDCVTLVKQLIEILESDASWVELYELTGELVVPNFDDEYDNPLLESVKKTLQEHQHPPQPHGAWRIMKIPVDVPRMHVVAAVCIKIKYDPETGHVGLRTLYAGQPIAANLSIHTSFHWGIEDRQEYAMRFDIEELVKDWLISGHKRGDFIARDGETFHVPLTLIALHHGELLLPRITVIALPFSSRTTVVSSDIPNVDTYQVHSAEKVLVLPRGGKSTFVVGMGMSRAS